MIVYLAGSNWDGIVGTDRQLAAALAAYSRVMWVDPPVSILRRRTTFGFRFSRLERLSHGIDRLTVVAPPGVTRPFSRDLASLLVGHAVRAAVRRSNETPDIVIVAGPEARFPRGLPGCRLLYLTDDWLAGAKLMGLSASRISALLAKNGAEAAVIAAVTPDLALAARSVTGRAEILVLANGTLLPDDQGSFRREVGRGPRGRAGLVGQLNERLDLDALEAVVASGVQVLVVGPRRDRDSTFSRKLEAFLARPGVTWMGERPADEIPGFLATIDVGLTPYVDNVFNRASFPLKTLEYLAAGCAVVSSDIPAARWLGTDLIEIASSPEDFARKVVDALMRGATESDHARRRAFASRHTWDARAQELLDMMRVPDCVQGR